MGLIVFDEKIRDFRRPSTRPGHLQALLHALEHADPSTGTNLQLAFEHFRQFLSRRGLVAVISDFYADPEAIIRGVRPLVHQGQDLAFFQVLDPAEIEPQLEQAALLEDMETGERMEVAQEYASEYRRRMKAHTQRMSTETRSLGADYRLMDTSKPLDLALREYLLFRERRR